MNKAIIYGTKKYFFISLLMVFLIFPLLQGCNREDDNLYAQTLVTVDNSLISAINVVYEGRNIEITNKDDINKLVSILGEVNIKQLSVKDESSLLQHKITEGEYLYLISLSSNKDLVGSAVILSEDTIVFFDTKTMKSNDRTVSYINLGKRNIKEIISLIDTLVVNLEH